MIVYIVPETQNLVRVKIIDRHDDIAVIEPIRDCDIISAQTVTREVPLQSLFELHNLYFTNKHLQKDYEEVIQ